MNITYNDKTDFLYIRLDFSKWGWKDLKGLGDIFMTMTFNFEFLNNDDIR